MIQRIQTLWLLLAAAAAFLTLKFPFYSGNVLTEEDPVTKTFENLSAQSNIFLLILSVTVGIVAIITVFLYKDRKQQFRICLVALIISILNIVLFFTRLKMFVEGNFTLYAFLPFIVPIFLFLAARSIRKDEKLIKSLDRLR